VKKDYFEDLKYFDEFQPVDPSSSKIVTSASIHSLHDPLQYAVYCTDSETESNVEVPIGEIDNGFALAALNENTNFYCTPCMSEIGEFPRCLDCQGSHVSFDLISLKSEEGKPSSHVTGYVRDVMV